MVVHIGVFLWEPHVVHEPEARDAHGDQQHSTAGKQALHVEPTSVAAVLEDMPERDASHRVHHPG